MHANGQKSLPAAQPPVPKPAATLEHQARRRTVRLQLMADTRREHVLEAARDAFVELGLEGASLREIARRAGYTPGALYSYFTSKEAVYGALLGESLQRLNAAVAAAPWPPDAAGQLRTKALAFFNFYLEHPRDLDLGFYLYRGLQPRGLNKSLNDELNASLLQALAPCGQALLDLGLDSEAALTETTALFAHMTGVLLLGHTGRIRLFAQRPPDLMERYLQQLLARMPRAGARKRGKR